MVHPLHAERRQNPLFIPEMAPSAPRPPPTPSTPSPTSTPSAPALSPSKTCPPRPRTTNHQLLPNPRLPLRPDPHRPPLPKNRRPLPPNPASTGPSTLNPNKPNSPASSSTPHSTSRQPPASRHAHHRPPHTWLRKMGRPARHPARRPSSSSNSPTTNSSSRRLRRPHHPSPPPTATGHIGIGDSAREGHHENSGHMDSRPLAQQRRNPPGPPHPPRPQRCHGPSTRQILQVRLTTSDFSTRQKKSGRRLGINVPVECVS